MVSPGKRGKLKHLATASIAAFLAFAPPGTLILLFGVATALFGRIAVVAGLAILSVTGIIWFMWKRSRRTPR